MKRLVPIPVILACLVCFAPAQESILVPSEHPTIQAAIDAAGEGDTIIVSEGTYLENVNLRGKGIILASLFLLDGDTSHIRKTIIDGSQGASAVSLINGEDATTVLMGFTITGGSGTLLEDGGWIAVYGGGILLDNSGGKILHNIIRDNHLQSDSTATCGAGIGGYVKSGNTLIIKGNIIRNNTATSGMAFGGGVFAERGSKLIEKNVIAQNSLLTQSHSAAAGIWCDGVIRDNLIDSNTAASGLGGGLVIAGEGASPAKIYNNIISNNTVPHKGAGIYAEENAVIMNNTIYNNVAENGGSSLYLASAHVLAFNNILWSGVADDEDNLQFDDDWGSCKLRLHNNLLSHPTTSDFITSRGANLDLDPVFGNDSLMLSEGSPAIGRGLDSLQYFAQGWYHAPSTDYAGNPRPGSVDNPTDIGAYESGFDLELLSNADLEYLKLWDRKFYPKFHSDSLHHAVLVKDTLTVVPEIEYGVKDVFAQASIQHAADLQSENEADRTSTITVTSSDGAQQKEYQVLFVNETGMASLDTLYFSIGELVPEFSPNTFTYSCCLPEGTDSIPEMYFRTSSPFVTALVQEATMVGQTFKIQVTADDGQKKENISISLEYCGVGVEAPETGKPRVYPMPARNYLNVEMPDCRPLRRIELLSLDGRIVRSMNHVLQSSVRLSTDTLTPGLYFLRIHSDETYTVKVLVE